MTSLSGMISSDQQQMDFMKLLVTELQNQNPLEPMDNKEMASQLAQFTQLSLSEDMNSNISEMNATMERMNASFHGAMLVEQRAQFRIAQHDRGAALVGPQSQPKCYLIETG